MRELKSVVCLAASMALTAGVAFSDRPLTIDNADPQDFKTIKLDGGGLYEKKAGFKHWDVPFNATVGIFPSLGIAAGFGGQAEERAEIEETSGKECTRSENGIDDLTLGMKWQFLKETTWLPRQAFVPGIKFPTADKNRGLGSGKADYDLTWIASKSLCKKMDAHVNIGYSFIGKSPNEDEGDMLHYGLAFEYRLVDPWQWVGEVFADKELRSGTETAVMFDTGFRWNPIDSLTLDIAAGSCLAGDAPDFTATAGLTWTFCWAQTANKP